MSHVIPKNRPRAAMLGASAIALLALALTGQRAAAQCGTGLGGTISLQTQGGQVVNATTPVHIGDIVCVSSVTVQNLNNSFATENLSGSLILPDQSSQPTMSIATMAAGQSCDPNGLNGAGLSCPVGTAVGVTGASCASFNGCYQVVFSDIGRGLTCATTTTTAGHILFKSIVQGTAVSGGVQQGDATACQSIQVPVIFPCISITKVCDNTCTPYGSPITFHGTISNTGNTPLFNIQVSDSPTATISVGTIDPIAGLAAGASVNYTGSYTPAGNLCGPFTDTISVTATDVTGLQISNMSDCINPTTGAVTTRTAVTATCTVCNNPCVTVTKNCADLPTTVTSSPSPQNFTVTGHVDNCGNVPLMNVHVWDTITLTPAGGGSPTTTTVDVLVNGSLGVPGVAGTGDSTLPLTTTVTVPAGFCGTVSDFFTVTADSVCPDANGGVVSALPTPPATAITSATCTFPVTCQPYIAVQKLVACLQANGTCPPVNSPLYQASATGVKNASGTQCPAFCYQITVTNPSTIPTGFPNAGAPNTVPLQNIVLSEVTSPTLDLTSCNSALAGQVLQPGQSITCTTPPVTHCEDTFVNTVAANGSSSAGVSAPQATSSATVNTVPISVNCSIALSQAFALSGDGSNNITIPSDQASTPITTVITVTNPSSVPLVVTVNTPGLVDCETGLTDLSTQTVNVAANGGTGTVNGCLNATCPGGLNLTVSVTGTVDTSVSGNTDCIYTLNNGVASAVTTDTSTCTATVVCQAPKTCRVTGGGVLIPGEQNDMDSCSPITTTVVGPECNGQQALKITHGGQLGAPYAQQDCGPVTTATALTGDPCIRGQWEHVRHYQGKANPQTGFEVDNFHSNTPKGIFDSLMCACLPCCENPTTTPGISANQGFTLCNPDDKNICGPQPRPAPANAITFTGIGYVKTCATSNGKKGNNAAPVVFRVYIEDRSEPGGAHPGGAKAPADIYCFQAWLVSDITGNSSGKIDDPAAIAFRSDLAANACAYIKAGGYGPTGANGLNLPSPTLDGLNAYINDCGALHTGNQQIHPSTDATCPVTTPPPAP